ncbi:MAG: SUMF1/EgtB/PvdO family nonheme iron enzyme, partial [Humidesulfovibrio sp.]|nr:SUMF1/EgtB/PvdO family nonheme iron enzyme [Humidesulfovibrio sp.]
MRRILPLLLLFLLLFCLALPAQAERRVALVIGNSAYPTARLKNPVNDARDMAAALKSLGFEVILRENAGLRQMNEAIDQFWGSLKKGGVGLFFFAGHGMQVAGENFLVPVDARVALEKDVQYECVNAGKVLGRMEDAGNGLNIVILDACRNNPFARSFRSESRGLAKMDAPTGSLVAFATAPGDVAADGAGKNGLYTSHLLRNLRTPGLKIEDVLKQTRIGVAADSAKMGKRQTPWESSSLMGEFYFAGGGSAGVVQQPAIQQSPAPTVPELVANSAGAAPPQLALAGRPHAAPAPAAGPKVGDTWTEPVTGMEFVWVPGGTYEMGCGPWAGECRKHELPAHTVRVDGFWMGKYEVTQGQWERVLGENHSVVQLGDDYPVETVSWDEAKAFITKLKAMSPGKFRLPTEAEWEYAARSGGKQEKYAGGADKDLVAWHSGNTGKASHPVGTKSPNGLGLHDMSGNVAEWCLDVFDLNAYAAHARDNPVVAVGGPDRVLRGGSWWGPDCTTTGRSEALARTRVYAISGFRLVRVPLSPPQAPAPAPAAVSQPAALQDLASRFAGRYAVAPGPSK